MIFTQNVFFWALGAGVSYLASRLSKSKVLNSGLMTRATPRYRSENARRALVT